jgi:hypothetical protein
LCINQLINGINISFSGLNLKIMKKYILAFQTAPVQAWTLFQNGEPLFSERQKMTAVKKSTDKVKESGGGILIILLSHGLPVVHKIA